MNIRVVATADIGSFIARDKEWAYYVLTLDDSREIDFGDSITGTFDGRGSLFYEVRNVTKGEDVRICLETWETSLTTSIEMLLGFMASHPGKIFVGPKRFESNAPGVAHLLEQEIRKI